MTERLIDKLDRLGAVAEIREMTPEIRRFAMLVRQDVVEGWPKREWIGLTDDDIAEKDWHLSADREYEQWTLQEQLVVCGVKDFARAIEAKLKEKNT
jgi:hypothetical protein